MKRFEKPKHGHGSIRSRIGWGLFLLFPLLAGADNVSYTYDSLNRLIRTDYGNGKYIEYSYDVAGNRITQVAAGNQAPTVSAGPDQTGKIGTRVDLHGTISDPDNGPSPLTFAWTQTLGPTVTLSNAGTLSPYFTPMAPSGPGGYVFRLSASDGQDSTSASVKITVPDVPMLVLSPNGGESWKAGTSQTIQWYTSPALVDMTIPVTIQFSKDGGATWSTIGRNLPNTGSYAWTPGAKSATAQGRIKVCSGGGKKKPTTVCDISDANFTILK